MRLVFVGESDLDLMGGVMTSALFSDQREMSGDEFLALGETSEHIELIDGGLHVTPGPTPRHQYASVELTAALRTAARASGLYALEGVNLQLRPNRILIPDIAIVGPIDFDQANIDARAVRLVCEIISPSSSAMDKVLKMQFYAAAGIPRYLIFEPKAGDLHLHELAGTTYREHSTTRVGEILHLTEPVMVDLDPAALMPD